MKYLTSIYYFFIFFVISSCQCKAESSQIQLERKETSDSTKSGNKGRILITGSTAGLGQLAAKTLISRGYRVVLHARNEKRAADVKKSLPGAEAVVIGDLSSIEQTKKLAMDINKLGAFDVVIFNAGVYYEPSDVIFKVNSLAPYILTSLIHKPKRLIYISSDMHLSGELKLTELEKPAPKINYPDSKLQLLTLAMAASRKWPDVYVNAVHPGWVPTRMGGSNAPDDLEKGFETQVWLAEGMEAATNTSGRYFFHKKDAKFKQIAKDINSQEKLLKIFGRITGVDFPDK